MRTLNLTEISNRIHELESLTKKLVTELQKQHKVNSNLLNKIQDLEHKNSIMNK